MGGYQLHYGIFRTYSLASKSDCKEKAPTIACLKFSSYEVILEILFKNNQVERNTL